MKFSTLLFTLFLLSCSSNYTKLEKREPYNAKGFAYITEDKFNKKTLKSTT